MKEDLCLQLGRTDGELDEKGVIITRASSTCFANREKDCPKSRAKFRITEVCFRQRKPQKKQGEN